MTTPAPEKLPPATASVSARRGSPKVLLLLLMIIVIAVAAFLLTRMGQGSATKITDTGQKTDAGPTDVISGANYYVNTMYGYTIAYPQDFSLIKVSGTDLPETFYSQSDDVSFSGGVREDDPASVVILGVKVNPTDETGETIFCSGDDDCLNKWLAVIGESESPEDYLNVQILGRQVKGVELRSEVGEDTQVKRYYAFYQKDDIFVVSLIANNYPEDEVEAALNDFAKYISSFKLE